MSARRATPEARCVWLTREQIVLIELAARTPWYGMPQVEKGALMAAVKAWDAAPADPAEALRGLISTAMLCVMPDPVAAFAAAETVTDAVLVALGWKASA